MAFRSRRAIRRGAAAHRLVCLLRTVEVQSRGRVRHPLPRLPGTEPASPAPNITQFDDMSTHEILSSEIIKRHGNPDWYRLESERGSVALLTEQAQMRALRLYMRYLNKESRDRVEALLAAKVQRRVQADASERLRRQREAAAKAGPP